MMANEGMNTGDAQKRNARSSTKGEMLQCALVRDALSRGAAAVRGGGALGPLGRGQKLHAGARTAGRPAGVSIGVRRARRCPALLVAVGDCLELYLHVALTSSAEAKTSSCQDTRWFWS